MRSFKIIVVLITIMVSTIGFMSAQPTANYRDRETVGRHQSDHRYAAGRAKKAHMKSLRRMAKADGRVTPRERSLLRRHARGNNQRGCRRNMR